MESVKNRNNFDAIRLIGALMVVFSHSFALTVSSSGSNEPLALYTVNNDFGHLGVSIFLFVSGYLIYSSLIKDASFMNFFKKRILRMIPALIVVVLFSAFFVGPLLTDLPLKDYLTSEKTYLYLKNIILFRPQYVLPGLFENCPKAGIVNGSLWTLAYEFFFYVALFVLITFTKNSRIIATVGIVLLIASIGILLSFKSQIQEHQYTLPFFQLNIYYLLDLSNYFLAGVILGCITFPKRMLSSLFVLGLLLFALTGLNIPYYNSIAFYVAVPFIVYSVAFMEKLNWSLWTRFGDFSYGIYLYAFVVQQAFISLSAPYSLNSYSFFAITASISYFFGGLSWHFVEKPFLRYKYLY